MESQVSEPTCGRNPTIGGSSDTEVNEPMVNPCGVPFESIPATTVTPVGKCPMTVRKCLESKACSFVCSVIAVDCTLRIVPDLNDAETTRVDRSPADRVGDAKRAMRSQMRTMRRSL